MILSQQIVFSPSECLRQELLLLIVDVAGLPEWSAPMRYCPWGWACCWRPLFRYSQLIEAQLIGSKYLNDLSDLKFLKDLDLSDLDDLNDLGDLSDGLQMGRAWAEYRQSTVRRYKRLERRQVSGSFFDSFRHQCRDFVLFIIMLARGHHAEDRANELGWEEIWILKTCFCFLCAAATVYIVYGRDSWKRNSRRRESWKGTWGEEAGCICCERSESFSV